MVCSHPWNFPGGAAGDTPSLKWLRDEVCSVRRLDTSETVRERNAVRKWLLYSGHKFPRCFHRNCLTSKTKICIPGLYHGGASKGHTSQLVAFAVQEEALTVQEVKQQLY